MNRSLLIFALLLSAGLSSAEPNNVLGTSATTGNFWVNHTWENPAYLIAGQGYGTFSGFEWGGAAWTTDATITSGLVDVGQESAPAVFEKDGTLYLVTGNSVGTFSGYHWTGSAWTSDSGIIAGLGGVGTFSKPTVFEIGGTWYLIAGERDAEFNGFIWTGSAWTSNSGIITGLSAGDRDTPTVFEKDGTLYLISGKYGGTFLGYHWTGSAWTSDSGIIAGLGDIGSYSAPNVLEICGNWYLVTGNNPGTFLGYHWTGSAWTSDSGIIAGLGDVGHHSTPMMFTMRSGIGEDDIDSFNVSINSVWHNTTTNDYYNDTPLSPHLWSNITIFSFNDTSGISSTSVSRDVPIPNNPITITNVADWDGYINRTVLVDCGYVDADSDTPTFSCNRTDLFSDFDAGNGEGGYYVTTPGTYYVDFGVSDGYGSSDNYTMVIDVADIFTSEYVPITSGGWSHADRTGVTYVYINNPDLLPCLVTLDEFGGYASSTSASTKSIGGLPVKCAETGVVDKYWANGTHEEVNRASLTYTTPWCDMGSNSGPDVTTSMFFTNMSDYFIVYGYVSSYDSRCWECDPTLDNTRAFLHIYTTVSARIVMHDASGNLVNHSQVSIQNIDTGEIVYKWADVKDGTIEMGVTSDTFRIAVRTFDGVFVHTCDLGADSVCEIVLPINYNLKIHPVDQNNKQLFDVFAGLAEYTAINPQAFWGMDLSDSGYVPVTNCSGFAMCDIIAEKDGYVDYRVEALNWTSKSALVKDYRHNVIMEEE